jgi:hypothetical protein
MLYVLLGAFPELRKATISFVMSISPSVISSFFQTEQLESKWTDFQEIRMRQFSEKIVEEIEIQILCSISFFYDSNAIYEIRRKICSGWWWLVHWS